MALVSQFGAATLAVQDALRRSVIIQPEASIVANFLMISLDKEEFLQEQESLDQLAIDLFRNQLQKEIEAFCLNNGWSFSRPLSLHVMLRSLKDRCSVRAEHHDVFYKLSIRDDNGERIVPVGFPTIVIGRSHHEPPRGFVPVYDASRSFSREHLLLLFQDMKLQVRLLGQNPTHLNNTLLTMNSEAIFVLGDVIHCGPHSIELLSLSV